MSTIKDFTFLLGGSDLEMSEIRKLLSAYKATSTSGFIIDYKDKKLQWGAGLSSYKNEIPELQTKNIVGIELQEDIPVPSNYIAIDHHDEKSDRPSSLEQVAEMLGIKLNRKQELIAANDRGYIPEMEAMGATWDEIIEIRNADKKAIGITRQDEENAKESVKHHLTVIDGIIVVKSLTSRFSPITDLLYPFTRMLIYSDSELTYYGSNSEKLKSIKVTSNCTIYSGGSKSFGFCGISIESDKKIKIDISSLCEQVIKLVAMDDKPFISSHIFLFPFKVTVNNSGSKSDSAFHDILIKCSWLEINDPDPLTPELYNVKKYFHGHVNTCIFPDPDPEKNLIEQYYYPVPDGSTYEIDIWKRLPLKDYNGFPKYLVQPKHDNYKFKKEGYSLDIEKVTLDYYPDTHVGIMAYHLKYRDDSTINEKKNQDEPYDILLINQFGRRLCPPFLDKHHINFKPPLGTLLEGTQHRELPISISLNMPGIQEVKEDFSSFSNGSYKINYVPKHMSFFFLDRKNFPDIPVDEIPSVLKSGVLKITPVLDDRMFVICWYGAKQLTDKIKNRKLTKTEEKAQFGLVLSNLCNRKKGGFEAVGFYRNPDQHKSLAMNKAYDGYEYATNDFWYRYVFVDGYSSSCCNELLQAQQIEDHTYSRWVEINTLYGVSRYSFVCITEPLEELNNPFPNAGFVVDHMHTVYYRMALLVLAQRAMILRFSDDIQHLNDKPKMTKSERDNFYDRAKQSFSKYLNFINNIYHREITAQEQGIELYDMLQNNLRIEYHAKELEKEYDELFRKLNLEETKKSNDHLLILTILGSVFFVPTFLLTLLSNKAFEIPKLEWTFSNKINWEGIFLVGILIFSAFFIGNTFSNWLENRWKTGTIMGKLFNDKPEKKWRKWRRYVLIGISIILIGYLILFPFLKAK